MSQPQTLRIDSDDLLTAIAALCSDGLNITFTPKGMSMYPFIVGDRDSVILYRTDKIRRGDIVAARISGMGCVLHRVYAVSDDRLTLMGDANCHFKEDCTPGDAVAVVKAIIRRRIHVDCLSYRERTAACIWMALLPVRKYLLWLLRKLRYRL